MSCELFLFICFALFFRWLTYSHLAVHLSLCRVYLFGYHWLGAFLSLLTTACL